MAYFLYVMVKKWLSILSSFMTEALHAQECWAYGVAVKPFSIKLELARIRCLSTQENINCYPVGEFYGTVLSFRTELP